MGPLLAEAKNSPSLDSSLQLVAATCLKELVSLGPSSFASRYTHKIEWLKVRNSVTTSRQPGLSFSDRICFIRLS